MSGQAGPIDERIAGAPASSSPRSPRHPEVADKVGANGPRVCLRNLMVRYAERSPLDHYDVEIKSQFGPNSPGVHTAPRFGPGFASTKLTPCEENERRRAATLQLADALDHTVAARKSWVPPPHMGLGSVPSTERLPPSRQARRSVVRKIEEHALRAVQPPLSARPSVPDLVFGRVPVAPPAAVTARIVRPEPPRAGFSFPKPNPDLLAAARGAAAATDAAAADGSGGREPEIVVLSSPNPNGDDDVPALDAAPATASSRAAGHHGTLPAVVSPSAAAAVRRPVPAAAMTPAATSLADVLQPFLPPLFPSPSSLRPSAAAAAAASAALSSPMSSSSVASGGSGGAAVHSSGGGAGRRKKGALRAIVENDPRHGTAGSSANDWGSSGSNRPMVAHHHHHRRQSSVTLPPTSKTFLDGQS